MNELPSISGPLPSEQTVHLQLGDGSTLNLSRVCAQACDPARLRQALAAAARTLNANPVTRSSATLEFGMVCGDARMRQLMSMLERVAPTDASVLVTGENGTGKELVARAVHARSPRAQAPFIAVNCSALNDSLLESELFGHRRGAFTGAVEDRMGMFEAADGGTLFLDEVGDMSPALQVRVLRVLQEGQITPVGDTQPRDVNVRVVAATHRNLEQAVADGAFREDLYYRLHVVALHLPALRERRDLDALVEHFGAALNHRLGVRKQLSEAAHALLRAHTWPGNVRQLANELERLWVLSGDDEYIGPAQLRDSVQASAAPSATTAASTALTAGALDHASLPDALAKVEAEIIGRALERARGNRTHTARALGISRRNLLRKIAALGL